MIDVHMIDSGCCPELCARQQEIVQHKSIVLQKGVYVSGNLLEARILSYSKGVNPYVTWIDDDDEVLDLSWIDHALYLLEDPKISAVYPRWHCTEDNKILYESPFIPWSFEYQDRKSGFPLAHHLTIMRRENVLQILNEFKINVGRMIKEQDRLLTYSMNLFGKLVPVENIAYNWKLRNNSTRIIKEAQTTSAWVNQYRLKIKGNRNN
jgi:hypothetical protein